MFTNWLAPPATTLPPDTIIEVGPPPFTRYAAHSTLVSVHSGYLRAALRSDSLASNADTMQIYVPNVTADQFTPLLTYMYTGFLDLNIENIFGVLLATHILHMPRALELCRSFLSATQTENYFGGLNALSSSSAADGHSLSQKLKPESETNKVVRPIASKATGIGLNFIAPPASHILLSSTHTPFKSLSTAVGTPPTVIVENAENSSPPRGNAKNAVLVETTVSTGQCHADVDDNSPKESNQKRQSKSLKRCSNKSESVVTTTTTTTTKDSRVVDKGVIIDIASCDGPVRFRRVLNDSYGMNSNSNNITPLDDSKAVSRYMSSSFHQQMVRNINERKQSLSLGESFSCATNKDENSLDNNQSQSSQQSTTSGAATGETYNCVYCKHTFKSQYCYQKHAKRHLIPLSLEANAPSIATTDSVATTEVDKDTSGAMCEKSRSKREVKPLDMNVQYYPCKTCGSKFPSYYFVHKHRKMCHAEEEVL